MNLFRSKEHAKGWSQYEPGTEDGILSLSDAMKVMSTPRHRDRLSRTYVSDLPDTTQAFVENLQEVTANSPYWDPRPS
jgi:hypothetical protein